MSEVRFPGIYKFSSTASDIISVAKILPLGEDFAKAVDAFSVATAIGTSIATLNPLPAIASIVFKFGGKFLSHIPVVGKLFGGGAKTVTKKIWVKALDWQPVLDAGNGMKFKLLYPKGGSLWLRIEVKCTPKCKAYYIGYKGNTMAVYALDLPDVEMKLCMIVIRQPLQGIKVRIEEFKANMENYMYSNEYLIVANKDNINDVVEAVRNRKLVFNVVEGTRINRLLRSISKKLAPIPEGELKSFLAKVLKFEFVRSQLATGIEIVLTHPTVKKKINIVGMYPQEDGLLWMDLKTGLHLAEHGLCTAIIDGQAYTLPYYDREFKNPFPLADFDRELISITATDLLAFGNPYDIIKLCQQFEDLYVIVKSEVLNFIIFLRQTYLKDKTKAIEIINNLPQGQKDLLSFFYLNWEKMVIEGVGIDKSVEEIREKTKKQAWTKATMTNTGMVIALALGLVLFLSKSSGGEYGGKSSTYRKV